eukprot:2146386-Alexandrium_andersonii.AAC.1
MPMPGSRSSRSRSSSSRCHPSLRRRPRPPRPPQPASKPAALHRRAWPPRPPKGPVSYTHLRAHETSAHL